MKPRILFCTEASVLATGYATYAREMISRLHQSGMVDIAEFGCYIRSDDSRVRNYPWKVYGNLFVNDNEKKIYDSHPVNVFGMWKFDEVVLDYMPNIVFDYRDEWMMSYELNSPLRECFHLIWMPTVDAECQKKEWLANYMQADSLFTYTEWGKQTLIKESGGHLKPITSLPAGADNRMKPVLNKTAHKAKFGLEKYKIVGTVMRNQRRKLFPDLFKTFRDFLDKTGRQDILLYCHTTYPDKHPWNIPELLNEYNLANKVLLTYRCGNCGNTFVSFFNDIAIPCHKCREVKASTANVQNGCSVEFLNEVYNLFDLYIQYANSEGQGLGPWEAAACAVPSIVVNYSGMKDAVDLMGAIGIDPITLYRELETGCMRAVPDNECCVQELIRLFQGNQLDGLGEATYKLYHENFGYDKSANKLLNHILTLNVEELQSKWRKQPKILNPPDAMPDNLSHSEFAIWLLTNVLGEPEKIGSYFHSRLIRDMNYGYTVGGMGGYYQNENTMWFTEQQLVEFDRKKAFDHFRTTRLRKNDFEMRRWNKINGR